MTEQMQGTDSHRQELHMLVRQRGLESALYQWEGDMILEGKTRDARENERNIRALKARRWTLQQEIETVGRGLKEIQRARRKAQG
jgi:hypothetical protein